MSRPSARSLAEAEAEYERMRLQLQDSERQRAEVSVALQRAQEMETKMQEELQARASALAAANAAAVQAQAQVQHAQAQAQSAQATASAAAAAAAAANAAASAVPVPQAVIPAAVTVPIATGVKLPNLAPFENVSGRGPSFDVWLRSLEQRMDYHVATGGAPDSDVWRFQFAVANLGATPLNWYHAVQSARGAVRMTTGPEM